MSLSDTNERMIKELTNDKKSYINHYAGLGCFLISVLFAVIGIEHYLIYAVWGLSFMLVNSIDNLRSS